MIRIVILGTGNVAHKLFDAFGAQKSIEVVQVYGRNEDALTYFNQQLSTTTDLSKIVEADVYFVAISDDAISDVSRAVEIKNGIMVHTSGSVSMKVLPKKMRRGVFYPLQTFSVDRKVDFKKIPICIEAENELDYNLLESLAAKITDSVFRINSKGRKSLHLAAVFANNFTNHIYYTAKEICEQHNVKFELLLPLIMETASKIEDLSPFDAQTGPARRNDVETIKKQRKQLKSKNHKKIYSLLSKSIKRTYGKKL